MFMFMFIHCHCDSAGRHFLALNRPSYLTQLHTGWQTKSFITLLTVRLLLLLLLRWCCELMMAAADGGCAVILRPLAESRRRCSPAPAASYY